MKLRQRKRRHLPQAKFHYLMQSIYSRVAKRFFELHLQGVEMRLAILDMQAHSEAAIQSLRDFSQAVAKLRIEGPAL